MSDKKTVDERIVSLDFDNKKFEQHVQKSLGTIDKLKKTLKFDDTNKNLEEFEKKVNDLNFSKLESTLETIKNKYSLWGIAVKRIAENVVDDTYRKMKDLANQAKNGGWQRALNIEQARFQFQGLGVDVQKAMNSASKAVDGTSYSLDSAAKVASQLAASGIKAGDTMTTYLQGVAGAAAMTGSSFEDIGNIFTTVAGNGRLYGEQLLQLSSRGLNVAAELGKQLGKSESDIRKLVSEGKIGFATFAEAMSNAFGKQSTKANETFQGALSNMRSALNRIGADFAEKLLPEARDVFNTLRISLNGFKDALEKFKIPDIFGRWVHRFATVIEMIALNKDVIQSLANSVEILRNAYGVLMSILKPVARAFIDVFPPPTGKQLNEITSKIIKITESLKLTKEQAEKVERVFRGLFAVMDIFKTVAESVWDTAKQVWKAFFPMSDSVLDIAAAIGDVLVELDYYVKVVAVTISYTLSYFNIMQRLAGAVQFTFNTVTTIVSAFIELFAHGIHSFANIVGSILSAILPGVESASDIFGFFYDMVTAASNGVTSLFAVVINKLTAFDKSIDSSDKMAKTFAGSFKIVQGSVSGAINALGAIGDVAFALGKAIGILVNGLYDFGKLFVSGVLEGAAPMLKPLGKVLEDITDIMKEFIAQINPGSIAAISFVAIMIMLSASITTFMKALSQATMGFAKVEGSISGFFNALTERIKPKEIKSKVTDVIIALAAAFAILSISLGLLAMIPADDLKKAGVAVIGMVAAMLLMAGAMVAMSIALKGAKVKEEIFGIAVNVLSMAVAVELLVHALQKLNELTVNDGLITKSLALGVVIFSIGTAIGMMHVITKDNKMNIQSALVILSFAYSMKQIVEAFTELFSYKIEEIYSRLPALFVLMAGFAGLSIAMSRVKFTSGAAFFAIALAIRTIAPVIGDAVDVLMGIDFVGAIKSLKGYESIIVAIAGLAVAASLAFSRILEAFKNFGNGMLTMSLGILALAKVVELIGSIEWKVLLKGTSFILVMMGMFALLSTVSQFTEKAQPIKMAASFMLMAGAVAALVAVAYLAGVIDPAILKRGQAFITRILLLFGALMLLSWFTKEAKPIQMAQMFIQMSLAVGILAAISYVLGSMDPEALKRATVTIMLYGALFAGLAIIARLTKDAKYMQMAAGILIITVAIGGLTGITWLIAQMKTEDIAKGIITIALLEVLLTTLSFIVNKVGDFSKNKLIGLAEMIAGIVLVGLEVLILGKMSVGDLAKGIIALGLITTALDLSFLILGKRGQTFSKNKFQAFYSVFAALLILCGELIVLGHQSVATIAKGTVALVLITTGLIVLMKQLEKIKMKSFDNGILKTLGMMIGSIIAIGLTLSTLAGKDWSSILSAGVALAGVFAAYTVVFKFINELNISNDMLMKLELLLIGSLTLKIVASAISNLAMYDWTSLIASAFAISKVLGAYTTAFRTIDGTNVNLTQLGMFGLGMLALLPVGLALAALSKCDWPNILAAGLALTLVLKTYTGAFKAMDNSNVNLAEIGLFLLGLVSIIPIAVAIGVLAQFDWQNTMGAAGAISLALLAYSAVFKIMSTINPAAAIQGAIALVSAFGALAIAFVEVIGIVGIVLVAVGALDELLDGALSSFAAKGAEVFEIIGEGIGKFVGGIVGGIAEAIMSKLPDIATDLSDFMNNLKPFIDGLNGIPDNAVSSIGTLVECLLMLSGAAFLDGLTEMIPFMKKNNLADFGTKFASLGEGLGGFVNAISWMPTDSLDKAKVAADTLKLLSDAVPKTGGILQALEGEQDFNAFKQGIVQLGNGISQFAVSVADLNMDDVEKGKAAGLMLAALAEAIPKTDGFLQAIEGSSDLRTFGNQLPILGNGIQGFANNVADLKMADVEKGEAAGGLLVGLFNKLGTTDPGIVGEFFTGSKSFATLGAQLPSFGNNLKIFADNVRDMSQSDAQKGAIVAGLLVGLFNKLDNTSTGVIDRFFGGGKSFEDFGEQLPGFGEDIAEFSEKVQGIKKINNAIKAINSLTDLIKVIPTDTTAAEAFGKVLKKIGKSFKSFGDNVNSVTYTTIINFRNQIEEMIEVSKELAKADFDALDKFQNKLRSISGYGVKSVAATSGETVNDALGQIRLKIPSFRTMGRKIAEAIIKGLNSKKGQINNTFSNILEPNTKIGDSPENNGTELGQRFDEGFIKGLENKELLKKVKKAGAKVGKAAEKGLRIELEIKSPSRVLDDDGTYTVLGYIKGIERNIPLISKYAQSMASSVTDTIRDDLQIHSPSKILDFLGQFTGQGFIDGIKKKIAEIKKIGSGTGKSFFEGLKDQISGFDLEKELKKFQKQNSNTFKKTELSDLLAGNKNKNKNKKKKTGSSSSRQTQAALEAEDFIAALTLYVKMTSDAVAKYKPFSTKLLEKAKVTVGGIVQHYYKTTALYIAQSTKHKDLRRAMALLADDMSKTVNKAIKAKIKKGYKGSMKSLAKNETKAALDEVYYAYDRFKETISNFDKNVIKTLQKVPNSLANFIKGYKSIADYGKNVVTAFTTSFGGKTKNATKVLDKFAVKLYQQSDAYKQSKANLKQYTKEYNHGLNKMKKILGKLNNKKYQKAIDILNNKKASKEAKKHAQKIKEQQEGLMKKYNEYAKKVTDAEKNIGKESQQMSKDVEKSMKTMLTSIKDTADSYITLSSLNWEPANLLEGFEKFAATTNLAMDSALDGIDNFVGGLSSATSSAENALNILSQNFQTSIDTFSYFSEVATADPIGLTENLDSQLEAWEEFQNGLKELEKKGLSQSVIDELEEQGPSALGYIRGLLNMSEDQMNEYNKKIKRKEDYEAEQLERSLNKQLKVYEKFYKNLEILRNKGISSSIMSQIGTDINNAGIVDVLTRIKDITNFNSIYSELLQAAQIGAVSSTDEIGSYVGKNFVNSLEAGIEKEENFKALLNKIKSMNYDERLIEYIKNMGADSGTEFINELLNYSSDDVNRVNKALAKKYGKVKSPIEIVTENVKDRLSKYNDYQLYMKAISKQIGQTSELYKYISNMGYEEGFEYAKSFAEATPEQLKKLSEEYAKFESENKKQRRKAAAEDLLQKKKDMMDFASNYEALAKANVPYAVLEELRDPTEENIQIISYLAETLKDSPKELDEMLKDYTSYHVTTTEEISARTAAALGYASDHVEDAAKGLIYKTSQTANNTATTVGRFAGLALNSGLYQGIMNNIDKFSVLGKYMIETFDEALRNAAGIHSPADITIEDGEHLDDGLALGIENNSDLPAKAAEAMLMAVNGTIANLAEKVSNDINLNPVIRPTLDTSLLDSQIKRLNAQFEAEHEYQTSIKNSKSDSENRANKGDVYFTQYNTSPKALNRLEIYRQTKNLFSSFTGRVGNPT